MVIEVKRKPNNHAIIADVQTHTVVAAPAGGAVGRVAHLLQGLGTQVAKLPQTAVMENPGADPAGVKVVGCPDFAHVAHLVAGRLRSSLRDTEQRQ